VTETLRFDPDDFEAALLAPGLYPATIDVARYQRSRTGSDMIEVVYALDAEGGERPVRVTDYFVVAGGSPQGRAVGRRRLLELLRACGLAPKPGDEISPAELFGHRVLVRVAHGEWQGAPRLRVTGYRRFDPTRTPF
jgi:hypothetical protein